MICSACGGDGQIELGAYRGDDGPEMRECRLCGGVITTDSLIEKFAQAAKNAGMSISEFKDTTFGPVRNLPNAEQREVALGIARAAVQRRKEQAEQRRQERLAHPVTLADMGQMNGNEIMNDLIRKGWTGWMTGR